MLHLVHLHGQFFIVYLPYMNSKWSSSECDLLSQHPEKVNVLATSWGKQLIYYVYMSSDGPQKWDSQFWRHCTVRFTCLKVIHVWQTRRWTSSVQAGKQRAVWSWKACTLITDFTNLAIAVHAAHEAGAVNYASCCTL